MKRFFSIIMVILLFSSSALGEPLAVSGELAGTVCWPENSSEEDATYIYRYSYPLLEGTDQVAEMINEFYRYTVDDAIAFDVPINGESLADPEIGQAVTEITATVTCSNEKYFSVLLTKRNDYGIAVSTIYAAQVFARTGIKAGKVTSLPYLLELLDNDEADEWLETRQTAKADACVRELIWEQIEDMMDDGDVAFYDDLDYDWFCEVFYPEEDFYLDANGDPVFFIEEGMIADLADGALFFPFLLDDLLDEI